MKEFINRPANGIYTRKLARMIARKKMEDEGMKHSCKSRRYSIVTPTGQPLSMRDSSTFSLKWRDYIGESMIYG